MVYRRITAMVLLAIVNTVAGKELSLYRVDSEGSTAEKSLKRHASSSASAQNMDLASTGESLSYVQANVDDRSGDRLRSEEARLRLEQRMQFFRNLQGGSMSMSMELEAAGAVVEDQDFLLGMAGQKSEKTVDLAGLQKKALHYAATFSEALAEDPDGVGRVRRREM